MRTSMPPRMLTGGGRRNRPKVTIEVMVHHDLRLSERGLTGDNVRRLSFCASGIAAEFHVGGAVRPLGTAVEFVLYRAAQEALTNVRRHARAEKVDVHILYGDESVELQVEDDGIGATHPGQGFGLVGVRERVALVGGEVDLAAAASGGFALRVRVPA